MLSTPRQTVYPTRSTLLPGPVTQRSVGVRRLRGIASQMNERSGNDEDAKRIDSEHKEAINDYLKGNVVEIEEENEGDVRPGAGKLKVLAGAGGALAGGALAGVAIAAAGLPLATVGTGAAVMGAVAGAAAGLAVTKEWVRGENINAAMEFDQARQPSAEQDEATCNEAGANTLQAGEGAEADEAPARVFAVGRHHHHHSPVRHGKAQEPAGSHEGKEEKDKKKM